MSEPMQAGAMRSTATRPNPAPGLFDAAARCLAEPDPARKQDLTAQIAVAWAAGQLGLDADTAGPVGEVPGRPARPELVAPHQLTGRKLSSPRGRAALIHAVAHIEFNAINLAWDAVQRFRDLPSAYYDDWVRVAAQEAQHFGLMRGRLRDLGHDYGDFPAHDGLWEMARRTAHDPLARMALVPRVLEARGLDVTPGMIARLRAVGDQQTADHLAIILREEVGHVAAGTRWFRYLCEQRGLAPLPAYFDLIATHLTGPVRGPFNLADRALAGFDPEELTYLEALSAGGGRNG
nr:ferritin-like domain-containing protein [Lamprocystis purpurea]